MVEEQELNLKVSEVVLVNSMFIGMIGGRVITQQKTHSKTLLKLASYLKGQGA